MLGLVRASIALEWPLAPLRPWIGLYDPFSPAFSRDPYPHLDRLRSEAPIYFSRPLGSFVFSRYDDVESILGDPRFSADRRRDQSRRNRILFRLMRLDEESGAVIAASLTSAAPADHRRERATVRGPFGRSSVEKLRPRVELHTGRLLDRAASRGEMDVIRDFASPLPMVVISELLGLPAADLPRLLAWSDAFIFLVDPLIRGASPTKMRRAFGELNAYLREIIAGKEREPADDLTSHLVMARARGELSEVEVRTLVMMLITAGHETMTNAVGNAVVSLLRNPGERGRLQADPGLMGSAIEEFLRCECPIQSSWRIATGDCEIRGTAIRKGQPVTMLIGAANRDPERFPDPHRLDLGRDPNGHIAFGFGPHYCLGPWLARLEAEVALASLLERFPSFSGEPSALQWKPAMGLRGVYALPISL